jgi:hypothetical protein
VDQAPLHVMPADLLPLGRQVQGRIHLTAIVIGDLRLSVWRRFGHQGTTAGWQ